MCRIVTVFIIITFSVLYSKSARILGIVSTPSYSHQIVFHSIWRELSIRGHEVVVLTTDPIKDKTLINLTVMSHSHSFKERFDSEDNTEKYMYQILDIIITYFKDVAIYQLSHPQVQDLINDKNQHFDLLLVESFVPSTLAFSERFKCPYIIISSLDVANYIHQYVGNPINPIVYPDYWNRYVGKMSFVERVVSICYFLLTKYYYQARLITINEGLIDKYFGHGYPSLDDIHKNVSMIFVNTEPIFQPIRPLVPAVIPIGGGMHLQKPKPLPSELKTLLDGATEGFIYFSLGTNIKIKQLYESRRRLILETFKELPYKVLWKSELEIKEISGNVFVRKWFPQQDIFRHPNIKLFITQGGLQSMEEAVYNNIAMVVMPFGGDQLLNARQMVNKGIALSVDYNTLDKAEFKNVILEVINNPKYRKNVEELAYLAKDQPTTGLERAIWWTEYVLRHKGAQHLRGPAINVPLYQQYMLDIFAVGLLILIISIVLLVIAIKSVIKLVKYLIINRKEKIE